MTYWQSERVMGGEIGKLRLWRDPATGQFVEADGKPVEYLR